MRPSRAAFTLIELLVVISIIAILIGLIFQGMKGATARANETKSLNNMRQIGTGLLMYASDNGGQFPPRQLDGDNQDRWPKLVNQYLNDTQIFAAPDDPKSFLKTHLDPISNGANNTSYIVNGGWDPGMSQSQVNERPLRTVSIQQPSKTIMVTAVFSDDNFYLDVAQGDDRSILNPKLFGGKSNSYVFMDGSARTIDYKSYQQMNQDGGNSSFLWLINKDGQN